MGKDSIDFSGKLRRTASGCALAAAFLLLLAAVFPARVPRALAQHAEVLALIIAGSTSVTDIPSDVVRTAYLGLRAEYKGVRLIPLNPPLKTPARERMDRTLLGLAPSEVGIFWIDQRVRDGRIAPRTVPSADVAVRVVAQLPGAITCVPASALSPHVRALRIDGKGPSDSGYLLGAQ
jgi:hypothetical protein